MAFDMDHVQYAQLFGPAEGDSVRLGDTNLYARVEKDYTVHGQECKYGGGKVLRDGMGVSATELRSENPQVVDMIISGAVIIDYTGIYKADVGIRDGKIAGIGKGGNPDLMDDVDFVVGASTEANGPHRRGGHEVLAAGLQDEGPARMPARRLRVLRQQPHQALRCQVHDQPRHRGGRL